MTRTTRPPHPLLTQRQLNRALLARQLLLERSGLDPVAAIEQLAGVQAQESASPYVALWTRLRTFDAGDLHQAFLDRTVVKTSLMRVTLHAVSARDYGAFLPAMLPLLRAPRRRGAASHPGPLDVPALAEAIMAFAATPRSTTEIRAHIAELAGAAIADDVWWVVRRHAPLVHVPDGVAWGFGRRPSLVAADMWFGDGFEPEGPATEHLVRRYLGAFGPATAADAAAWSGLPVGRLRPALEVVGERRFADERGRELFDLPDAPLPDQDVPAPPRLMPMWDSTLLAYADRTRIVSDADRALVIARNGDVAPTILVDGEVAGLWWTEKAGTGYRIVLEPFRHLGAADRRALETEAERLIAFLEPREPGAYGRYRTTGARRLMT
jgi:hypothetical protein